MKEERDIKENKGRLSGEAEIDEALELLRQMEAVDKRRGYERVVRPVKSRLRRMRIWRRVASVAAVFATVAVGVGVWKTSEPVDMPVTVATIDSIVPGRPTARLVLADRREVLLDTLSSGRVAQSSGVAIRKEGEKVIYEASSEKSASRVEYNELLVPRGGEYDIVLEDGTRVWMNADSRLRYPVAFRGKERRVYLEGEAYFEVERDTSRPFVVETERQAIRVLGTSFDVNAYPGDELHYTVLARGSVAVGDKRTGEERVLSPGEQLVFNVESGGVIVERVDVGQAVAWKDGMFVFDGLTLDQIMTKLARWYNVTVFFRNAGADELVFKGNLPRYADFHAVLEVLEKSSDVRFDVNGHVVTVNL